MRRWHHHLSDCHSFNPYWNFHWHNQMSYFGYLKRTYPSTYKVRYALQRYNSHREWEHQDPTTITVHQTTLNYGGPEEGGWWYQAGYPVQTYCIFSKKQAIQTFIELFDEYELAEQPSLGQSTTYYNYDVNYANDYAKVYPESKPYYCWWQAHWHRRLVWVSTNGTCTYTSWTTGRSTRTHRVTYQGVPYKTQGLINTLQHWQDWRNTV